MPFFKRRNAVKVKQPKSAPQESPIKEDETFVISEINSMLNEPVTTVTDQADSSTRINGHSDDLSKHDISIETDSDQGKDSCCSPDSTNSTSFKKDSLLEHNEGSSSITKNNISETACLSNANDVCRTEVQVNNSSKEIEITQQNTECTDALKANNAPKNANSEKNDKSVNKAVIEDDGKVEDSVKPNGELSKSSTINESNYQEKDKNGNPPPENDTSIQIDSIQTDNEDLTIIQTNNISKDIDSVHESVEQNKHTTAEHISNPTKQELVDSGINKRDLSETDPPGNTQAQGKVISKKKTRSFSESGSTIESQIKHVRRKFGSEAEVLSICKKILPLDQQQCINEAVVKYIDNVIKQSILKAVQNINVDNLCEELIKDVSSRTNSQGNESEEDFVVEQRLTSNSISELVELQTNGEKTNEEECSMLAEFDGRISETESTGNETDDVDCISFRGYLADLEDTASIDDQKSAEEDSLYNSSGSGFETKLKFQSSNLKSKDSDNITDLKSSDKTVDNYINETTPKNEQILNDDQKVQGNSQHNELLHEQEQITDAASELVAENKKSELCDEENDSEIQRDRENTLVAEKENDDLLHKNNCGNDDTLLLQENFQRTDNNVYMLENNSVTCLKIISPENSEISLQSLDEDTSLIMKNDFKVDENENNSLVKGTNIQNQSTSEEEQMKINWKVGNLHVKLPHKSRGKTSLKAWKKRRVVIQPDEFVNDPTNQSLVISVYGSKKHETTFWYSVSSQKAVVFRSSSHTHRYAFTISEGGEAIIHLSAENESETQEWMAAIRAVLWPPSPFMELEKMLSGQEFEVSIIDNEFSYHAGLLGMYGYLSITPKKLILLHPQQGYVIQEWYLNTVDKLQFVLQQKAEDMHKVLCMTTCKDSSTGQGDIIFFCKEAVTLLQALASTIHQVLSYHSKQEGGKYQKELEELAEWMVAPPQDCLNVENDEHYKVPPRQVKSLLDIPNFIFNKSLSPVASAIYPAPNTEVMETLDATKSKLTNTSQDSGISTCTSGDDFLNCSSASFILGGGPMTGKSSDSELSDTYTPPRTPEMMKKKMQTEVVKKESSVLAE